LQIDFLADLVQSFGKDKKVGILGLTYKLGTGVTEESAGVRLRGELADRGTNRICIEGPSTTVNECVSSSDVIAVVLPDPRFFLPVENFQGKVVIDCWRAMGYLLGVEGVTYVPLGIGR
jgi:hypothetical protein